MTEGPRRRAGQASPDAEELADLVVAARSGDREAFDEIVRATHRDVYTLALRLCGNAEDASDVTQDVYVRAYKGLRRFRGDAQLSTWLYRITANCAATQLRRRARHRHDELDDTVDVADRSPELDPTLRAEAAAARSAVDWALRQLPPRLRAVVTLRDAYDLSHREIAEALGISESAAKVRLHRARRRLRTILSGGRTPELEDGEDRGARAG